MSDNVVFISMEGRKDFKIGNFSVREDISLPLILNEGEKLSPDMVNPERIIAGMLNIITEDPDNDNIEYYREFIFSVQPDIDKKLSNTAYEAEKNHIYPEALKIYQILLSLKPDSIDNNLNIAISCHDYSNYLLNQGNDKEALYYEERSFHFFKIIENYEIKNDKVLYFLGKFFLEKENFLKCIEYFKEFVKTTENKDKKKEVLKVLGDIQKDGVTDSDYQAALELILSDNEEEAFDFIEKFIVKYPESWNGPYLTGWAFRKMKKFKEAIAFFEKALLLNNKSSDIYNEIGICYMNLLDFKKSELYFSKALRRNPEDTVIINNLALNSFKKGNIEEALKYCDVILEFNPGETKTVKLKKFILENKS